ncbi:MAG: hypothetical protein JWO36_2883 [Myxococcales bacterium]|nr:hypothetical protein [Myxococcales bacterium]
MDKVKFGVLASGILGIVGCFLPHISDGDFSFTFWGLRDLIGTEHVVMVLGAYAVAALIGLFAVVKPPMYRWQAILSGGALGFVVYKFRGGFSDLITQGPIGAKLMGIAAITGIVFSVLSLVKPEDRK